MAPSRAGRSADAGNTRYVQVKNVGDFVNVDAGPGKYTSQPRQIVVVDGEKVLVYAFWKLVHRNSAEALAEVAQNKEELAALHAAVRAR